MSDRKNILFVVPVFQSIYPRPFGNFAAMLLNAAHNEGAKYSFSVSVPEREILHSAMNRIAQAVLTSDMDAVIICDDDCFPPVDAISRLLRHYESGKAIVAGLGHMRQYPFTTTVGRYYPEGITLSYDELSGAPTLKGFEWLDHLTTTDGVIEADFTGFPIVLISREALQRIGAPWFGTSIEGGPCTHDVFFGHRAGLAKEKIYVDCTLDCDHLGEAPVVTKQNRTIARRVMQVHQGRASA